MVDMNTPATPNPQAQVNTWIMLCHLSALCGIVIPFGHIILPLVLWLVKKQEIPAVDEHGKEVLNFQISMTIYGFVAFLTTFILIGFILLPALGITWLILVIMAAVKTNTGAMYRYPLTIRFIK